jgi:dihydropteroate synthase
VSSWKLAGRTLDLTRPIAAGIVNVTVDSMFEGARSGTPEQAVADGLALAEAGFEMLDVGAVAAKAGPPVEPEEEAAALVPAVEGLATQLWGGGVGCVWGGQREKKKKPPQRVGGADFRR